MNRRFPRLGAILPLLLFLPAMAGLAQERTIPIGSRLPRWERPVIASEARAIRTLRAFADCLARKAVEAPQLLGALPETEAEENVVRALTSGRRKCSFAAGELHLRPYLFRGVIAEALYRRRAAAGAAPPPPSALPEGFEAFAARLTSADRNGLDEEDSNLLVGRWLGYCAAHENPSALASLLATEPSTPAEIAALRALRPTLDGCLFQGQVADLGAVAIRALLAEALYQRQLD
jgi:hypothetical protein